MPPKTKELVKILNSLQSLIPSIARFERSNIAMDMARQALDFESLPETKERRKKTEATIPVTTLQAALTSEEPTPELAPTPEPEPTLEPEPTPEPAPKQNKKKKIKSDAKTIEPNK